MSLAVRVSMCALFALACEEAPLPAPPPAEGATGADVIGEYTGTATYFPDHVVHYERALEPPNGRRVEAAATASLSDLRSGNGAELATLALRLGDERITTEVILLPRGSSVQLSATRPARCGALETAAGTSGVVEGGELVIEQLRLEEACTLGEASARYWQFRGRATRP